jgi:hypothetical protein
MFLYLVGPVGSRPPNKPRHHARRAAAGILAAALGVPAPGVLVQGDDPDAGGGLGWAFDDLMACGGALPDDLQLAAVEVEVGPSQAGGLAAA